MAGSFGSLHLWTGGLLSLGRCNPLAFNRCRHEYKVVRRDRNFALKIVMRRSERWDGATLLTGDLDFKPLLDALVQDGMFVKLWFPPHKTNKQLISSADQRLQLDVRSIYPALHSTSRTLFSLPTGSGEGTRGDIGLVLHAWNSDDGEIRLFQCPDRTYVLAIPDPNPGRCTYWSHTDVNILKTFAFDVFSLSS